MVLVILAVFAQTLNYVFDGSGADFMTLRYGNGNPFAFILAENPIYYYLLLSVVSIVVTSLVLIVTIGIRHLIDKRIAALK